MTLFLRQNNTLCCSLMFLSLLRLPAKPLYKSICEASRSFSLLALSSEFVNGTAHIEWNRASEIALRASFLFIFISHRVISWMKFSCCLSTRERESSLRLCHKCYPLLAFFTITTQSCAAERRRKQATREWEFVRIHRAFEIKIANDSTLFFWSLLTQNVYGEGIFRRRDDSQLRLIPSEQRERIAKQFALWNSPWIN